MKQLTKTFVAGGLLACSSLAFADFSFNGGLTSDYVFRGISQADEKPAIQGGADYTHDSGLYAGIWGSKVDFGPFGVDADMEVDLYGGFKGEFAGGLGWDVGALYYAYPGSDEEDVGVGELNYWEAKGALSYTFKDVALAPSVGLALYYSPEFTGEIGDALFVVGSLGLTLPQDFGLSLHVGQQNLDEDEAVVDSYLEYGIGISKTVGGFNLALNYSATDDDGETFGGDMADDRVALSVSRSF